MLKQLLLSFTVLLIFSVITEAANNDASLGQFPYQVSVQEIVLGGQPAHRCGGAIIAPAWILTSANCYHSESLGYVIVAGTLQSHSQTNPERQERDVTRFIRHPDFNDSHRLPQNDIALLQLTEDLVYNDFVDEVNLPKLTATLKKNPTITGWGFIDDKFSNNLQYQIAPLISDKECEEVYPDRIPVKQKCYGPLDEVCLGYTGDPLVYNNTIRGIASFPKKGACDSEEYPYIYTDVLMYMDFIEKYVRK